MQDVRVVLWGLGAMGGGIGRALAGRQGVQLVGGIAGRPEREGQDLGQVLGLEQPLDVACGTDAETVLRQAAGRMLMHATRSTVAEVEQEILLALDLGYDVISIAEEMAYPAASGGAAAARIHRRALERGRTVLGTGINPGFILDSLILALTAACLEVSSIHARRVNNLAPFGPTVMRSQGVGTTPEEFERGLESGEIVGHVGFPESIRLVAGALGWQVERIEQSREPIIATRQRRGQHITVPAGRVAGCNHTARCYVEGRPVLIMEHPQQIEPEAEGTDTGDFISIKGTPDIDMAIRPEIPGGLGTIALACNMLVAVLKAPPGLTTMPQLPLPRALPADIRQLLAADGG